ncbi:hypothetical protein S021_08725 [Salmonella enterica subsp. enterica]|nr:hypothetical protein [Salmonella enterica subsp. enterica serovar Alachua]EAA8439934.1 hypothetical protein [Salmonella enterica subsp. enterica]EAN3536359.1 hypothetical protein [Salmonella enterica]EBS0649615.1 hypothetical protein [Salmonella enterica subsp. enterica serovar Yolo]EBS1102023.1 hypothetical protein [Salmonella enterica subsp. enterica serovar Virchow]EBV7983712.1 hypothetical protein [Salmonella enterica subsp. enterica serovar Michigan]ECA2230279.1 hypothetical protein [
MTVTKAFGKLGMLAVKGIPVVGPVIDAAKELSQGLIDRENRERQRRLQDYVLGVVRDEQYNDTVEFREEDVIPVIRKLAADDETAKTEYYTRLTVSLGRTPLSVMPDDLRYHFIRLVSSLTCYQIAFARELKIRKTVPVRGTASFEEAELALTGLDSGMAMQAVRALQNAGLLKEKTYLPREQKPEGILYETTSDFTTLMGLLFHPSDFEPETVDLQRKEISDIIIVGKIGFIDNLYVTYLPAALKKAGLNAKFVESNDKHFTTDWAPLYLQTGIEGEGYDRRIKLYLTRESLPPWKSKADNYLSCSFETRTYVRDKSSSKKEADYFREQMDRVVTSIQTQFNKIKSSS